MSDKIYHLAGKCRADGAMSARCFKRPRPIDLRVASWTFLPEQVTCDACRFIIAARSTEEAADAPERR